MELDVLGRLDGIGDDLAKLTREFEPALLSGQQAQRAVCLAADIERAAVTIKTLAVRRVDETNAWRANGARSAADWLANKTGTPFGEATNTVTLGEQLERLPDTKDAAKQGTLSPAQAQMIANAASKDPDSEAHLLELARTAPLPALRKGCVAAAQRAGGPDGLGKIHARRSFRDWTDADGAYRFTGTLTPDNGARFKKALEGFANEAFNSARKAGIRDTQEQYAADGLVAMAEAALTNTSPTADGTRPAPPAYTETRTRIVFLIDATAWMRGYTRPGETCEIAGIGPIDVRTAKSMVGNAIIDFVVTHGLDVRTLAHAKHAVTKAQYTALLAEGYECNVDGCSNSRYLQIDHLGDGWAINRTTSNGELAWKCPHCHGLKTYRGFTDGPPLPNGKRKLIPPTKRPPPDG